MEHKNRWIFPQEIKFNEVPDFLERLDEYEMGTRIVLDLRKTETVHSSFIGFLIHLMENTRKARGDLFILPSCSFEKVLLMMGLYEYFSPAMLTSLRKKTA